MNGVKRAHSHHACPPNSVTVLAIFDTCGTKQLSCSQAALAQSPAALAMRQTASSRRTRQKYQAPSPATAELSEVTLRLCSGHVILTAASRPQQSNGAGDRHVHASMHQSVRRHVRVAQHLSAWQIARSSPGPAQTTPLPS